MANEQNKIEADLEKALGEIAKAGVDRDIRDARPPNWTPQRTTPPAPAYEPMSTRSIPRTAPHPSPLALLAEAADQAHLTLDKAHQLVAAMTGENAPPASTAGKPPTGMMPTIAYTSEDICAALAQVRMLIERLRKLA